MTDFDENVTSRTEPQEQSTVRKSGKRKTIIITVISLLCISLVIVLGVGIKRGAFEKNASAQESQTSRKQLPEIPKKGFGPEPGECDVLGVVIVEGKTYVQTTTDEKSYTPDVCLGEASDFEGTYKTHLTDVKGKVYRVKESKDILIVELDDGAVITLVKSEE